LISGPLLLGVRPNHKVDGVALILGNALSVNKMVAEPIVVKLVVMMCPSTCNVLNLVDKPNQKNKGSITSTNSSV
jgi:hypothetical protein